MSETKQLSAAAGIVSVGSILIAMVALILASSADRSADQTSTVVDIALRGQQKCEKRLDAYDATVNKVVASHARLEAKLRLASKDRDIAVLILADVRIASGAVAASQKGRFRAPYIKPRKRP